MGKVKEYYTDEDMLEALGVIRHKKNIYTIMQDIFKEYDKAKSQVNSDVVTANYDFNEDGGVNMTVNAYNYKK